MWMFHFFLNFNSTSSETLRINTLSNIESLSAEKELSKGFFEEYSAQPNNNKKLSILKICWNEHLEGIQ